MLKSYVDEKLIKSKEFVKKQIDEDNFSIKNRLSDLNKLYNLSLLINPNKNIDNDDIINFLSIVYSKENKANISLSKFTEYYDEFLNELLGSEIVGTYYEILHDFLRNHLTNLDYISIQNDENIFEIVEINLIPIRKLKINKIKDK
jgi:hypothetical protein